MKKSARYWDAPTAALLVILVQISAMRLVITDWASDLYLIQTLAFLGTILGLALGVSKFQRRAPFWLAFGYGLILIPWRTLEMTTKADRIVLERLAEIGNRLLVSFGQFATRQPVDDIIFFVSLVSVGFWIVAVHAGFSLTRRGDYLRAIIPSGLIILIVQGYDPFSSTRLWGLGIFIFVALLILGRVYFVNNRAQWVRERVFLSPEASQDLNRQLFMFAAIAVVVAWSVPASALEWKSAANAWRKVTRPIRERFSNAVSALEASNMESAFSGAYYGERLPFSREASQGDGVVFSVRLDAPIDKPPRYFWRGRVYDSYNNGVWSTNSVSSVNFAPDNAEISTVANSESRAETNATFTSSFPKQTLLFTIADPFWINRNGMIQISNAGDQNIEISAWIAAPALSSGDTYQVRAWMVNPTVKDLRSAGTKYPEWVTNRYLQIPEEIAREILPLAQEVTKDKNTPYDKVNAITNYLRNEIKYSPSLDALPTREDPTLWALFTTKEGFCYYYASAEVLMLRSLGIPARMAVGFAQGEMTKVSPKENSASDEVDIYTVRYKHAHAWPEVYFPGIGWVEFEPTGNQAPLSRPLGIQSNLTPTIRTPLARPEEEPLTEPDVADRNPTEPNVGYPKFKSILFSSAYVALLAGLIGAGIFLNRRYALADRLPVYLVNRYIKAGNQPPRWLDRWARWATLTSIERSFETINWSLRKLGHPQSMHITPAERAKILSELLPESAEFIDILIVEHQTALFTPRAGDVKRAKRASLKITLETWRTRLKKVF